MLLLCILHVGIAPAIHSEKPNMLQVMAENKYPDQPDIHHSYDIRFQPMLTQHLHPLPPPLSLIYSEVQRITAGTRRHRQCTVAPGTPSAFAMCGYTGTFMTVAVLSAARPHIMMPATAAPMASFSEPEEICSIHVASRHYRSRCYP